ncbi:MAG TPA: type II toxin-antitoxin system VapC family toxin [Pseudonocardia sp.]
MKLLLDTHALLWWLFRIPRLGGKTRARVGSPDNEVFVSAVSGYEITVKQSVGKLEAPSDLEDQISVNGFRSLPLTLHHATVAGELPLHTRDPFDRMLVAQARCEGLTLVTADRAVRVYDVPILDAAT